ncbi:MAG: molybdenum cofactor guanylyltransferase [Chitinophagales bacterium]
MKKTNSITGIILAGGKSSRMGTNKALIPINNVPMIEQIINTLNFICDDIIVIANNDLPIKGNFKIQKDIIENCGPMGGIHAGLNASSSFKNIIVSCDAPYTNLKALQCLIDYTKNSNCTLFEHENKMHPLPGCYTTNCLPTITENLTQNKLKLRETVTSLNPKMINIEKLLFKKDYLKALININTPEDLKEFI